MPVRIKQIFASQITGEQKICSLLFEVNDATMPKHEEVKKGATCTEIKL